MILTAIYNKGLNFDTESDSKESCLRQAAAHGVGRFVKQLIDDRNRTVYSLQDGGWIDPTAYINEAIAQEGDSLRFCWPNLSDRINATTSIGVKVVVERIRRDNLVTLKVKNPETNKVIRYFQATITIEGIIPKKHKFGRDMKCEGCGVDLFDIANPTGICG